MDLCRLLSRRIECRLPAGAAGKDERHRRGKLSEYFTFAAIGHALGDMERCIASARLRASAAPLLPTVGDARNVAVSLAYSGSEIARWAEGGDLNGLLVETARQLKAVGYRVTTVIWDQGESDYVKGTSADDYRARFLSMVNTLREQAIGAPVHITIASKCLEPSNGGFKTHVPDNSIVRAQLALSRSGDGLRAGVNTDTLLGETDRYDDCHLAGTGTEKVSRAWARLLLFEH